MQNYLQNTLGATADEMDYVDRLSKLRMKTRESSRSTFSYSYPSLVIDNFLYHGDLGHATNLGLLNQLGIKHIVNVCDCPLDDMVKEKLNVLWINLYDELKADIKQHFDKTNQFLYECKEKNEKVLVNCQMGISRSSTIVLAYLMK